MENHIIFVYSTYPSQSAAQQSVHALLEQKLIACANIFQSLIMYWWEGKIENTDEWVMIAKTIDQQFDDVVAMIKQHHTYQLPCIVKIPVHADAPFGSWVQQISK